MIIHPFATVGLFIVFTIILYLLIDEITLERRLEINVDIKLEIRHYKNGIWKLLSNIDNNGTIKAKEFVGKEVVDVLDKYLTYMNRNKK